MKTQQFKGQQLTYTKTKNNILRVWRQTNNDDRKDWYQRAKDFAYDLSLGTDINPVKIIGVIAALSPQRRWSTNLDLAEQVVKTREVKHMPVFVQKAKDILACDGEPSTICDILKGRKIVSFFLNILDPSKAAIITIDRHALSIALGYKVTDEDYKGMTKNQYQFFVDCYKLAANKVGVNALLMQSATWVRFRKLNNIK